jgi:hypothetical protein
MAVCLRVVTADQSQALPQYVCGRKQASPRLQHPSTAAATGVCCVRRLLIVRGAASYGFNSAPGDG